MAAFFVRAPSGFVGMPGPRCRARADRCATRMRTAAARGARYPLRSRPDRTPACAPHSLPAR